MALVTESAATSRSLRRLRTLFTALAVPFGCVNACLTSPPSPARVSPGVLGVLLLPIGIGGGEWFLARGELFGVDRGEAWF